MITDCELDRQYAEIARLTDCGLLELAAKAADELDHQHAEIERLTAENEALKAAVSEAMAAERKACEERVEDLYEKIETPYLVDIALAIHACDKA